MKSLQVAKHNIPDADNYTELQVMRSAAGYYVGTYYNNYDDIGALLFQEPGSRESAYFRTEEEARACLARIEGGDRSEVRWAP
jgi:hypothetical protein